MKYGFFCLILWLLFESCSKEPSALTTPTPVEKFLKLTVSKDNAPADNYTYAEIMAVTGRKPSAGDFLEFQTDKGVFANNSNIYKVNIAATDTTRAYVKYNKADVAHVTARLANQDSKEVQITFVPAYPSQILIYPDSSTLRPLFTSKSMVTAKLLRTAGVVSEGQFLQYTDSAATDGRSIGIFLNGTYSGPQGTASVEYHLQDTSYHGFVYIIGSIVSGTNTITGRNRIFIK